MDFVKYILGYENTISHLIFLLVLFVASLEDIKKRIISDKIHLCIIVLALVNGINYENIIAFFVIPLPFLILALAKDGAIGGGDIKFISVCSLFLGINGGYLGTLLGLAVAVSVNKIKSNDIFPMVPYLSIGYFLCVFLIYLN